MSKLSRIAVALLACSAVSGRVWAFGIYTVGGDAACNYSTITAAVEAARLNAGEDYVWVANNKAYSNEHVYVHDQDVIIEGGFTDCSDFDIQSGDVTIVSGGYHIGPVFQFAGSSHVLMRGFIVTRADVGDDQTGGGILFSGHGSLELIDTSVTYNRAGYGGGIAISPDGPATLAIDDNTLVLGNKAAQSGGGIRIEGNTRLTIVGDRIDIGFNEALGSYGGGIEVIGPARADVMSRGYNGLGVLNNNDAIDGGGIAVVQNGNGGGVARVMAVSNTVPTVFENNTAFDKGGAMYVDPGSDACFYASSLRHNTAVDGAAVYKSGFGGGGGVYFNVPTPVPRLGFNCGPESVAAFGGSTDCAFGASCNAIADNVTKDRDGNATPGAILSRESGVLVGGNLRVQHNTAENIVYSNHGTTTMRRWLVTDNLARGSLFSLNGYDGSPTTVGESTIANNIIGGHVFELHQQDFTTIGYDIVDELGVPDVDFTPYNASAALSASYILSRDVSTYPSPGLNDIIAGDPRFVLPAIGDYTLLNDSPALDYAPASGEDLSLGCTYGAFDLPHVVNRHGTQDLGAYELVSDDRLFASGMGEPMKPIACE